MIEISSITGHFNVQVSRGLKLRVDLKVDKRVSSIKVKDFLEKESTKTIIDSLRKKLSLRKVAKDSGYSLGTVQKVKKLYDKNLTEIELNMTVADLLPKLNEVRVRVRNKKTKEKK
jgi:predicted regulator of amino acid metabolism with ACT domain